VVPYPDLPALLIVWAPGWEGVTPLLVDGTARAAFFVNHLLLVEPMAAGLAEDRLYTMLTHIDNYLGAVEADWLLNDNLAEPLQVVRTDIGPHEYGGQLYIGVLFGLKLVV
jgi:hypothetical protein